MYGKENSRTEEKEYQEWSELRHELHSWHNFHFPFHSWKLKDFDFWGSVCAIKKQQRDTWLKLYRSCLVLSGCLFRISPGSLSIPTRILWLNSLFLEWCHHGKSTAVTSPTLPSKLFNLVWYEILISVLETVCGRSLWCYALLVGKYLQTFR